uniref:Uncharacterized protein n=1 Tax=Ascaris lumbricoides TaxID=6252 RepID=A0A0M3IH63_ASCLU
MWLVMNGSFMRLLYATVRNSSLRQFWISLISFPSPASISIMGFAGSLEVKKPTNVFSMWLFALPHLDCVQYLFSDIDPSGLRSKIVRRRHDPEKLQFTPEATISGYRAGNLQYLKRATRPKEPSSHENAEKIRKKMGLPRAFISSHLI